MATKYGQGLVKVEIGPIAVDGGMAADSDLVALGDTLQGTMAFTTANGTTTNIFIEEQDDAAISNSHPGDKTLKWSCINVSTDMLVRLFGGAKVAGSAGTSPEIWEAPSSVENIEVSVKVTAQQGKVVKFVRMSLVPQFNWAFTRDKPAQIDITATLLTPTKANTAPYTIEQTV